LQAEGAQIYECKPIKSGVLARQFREPIATLIHGSSTVGHHALGPKWMVEGVTITAKAVESAPGKTAADIPELKLAVTNPESSDAAAVPRVDTKGGQLEGSCDTAGAFGAIPYSALYIVLEK
jgi:hypothetical protein